MLAVLFNQIEGSIQDILTSNIKRKYPSISFEILDKPSIVADRPPETIILVISEEIVSDVYLKMIQGAHQTLEHLICLVSPEKYEEYHNKYSSYCKVVKKTMKDIQVWFDRVEGEPKPLNKQASSAPVVDAVIGDLELDALNLEGEEKDTPPEIDLELEVDEPPPLEMEFDQSQFLNEEEFLDILNASSDTIELNNETEIDELSIDAHALTINEKDLDLELAIKNDDAELPVNLPTIDEGSLDNLSLELDENKVVELTPPIEVEEKVVVTPNKVDAPSKLQKENEEKERFEEKVIALRDGIDIPVWKKKQINSKMIGIWSPLQRIGVTTFSMNLALYIASLSIPVAVLEGITKNIKMKSLLEVYGKRKSNWISYNSYLERPQEKAKNAVWPYLNANFFPFEEHDIASKWTEQKIHNFMNGLKFHDLVFIDFPTGEMAPYTIESLKHIDELWVVINNDLLSMMEWKEYIQNKVSPHVKVHGVFIDEFQFSKPKKIAGQLNLDLITSIPVLHQEVARNYYESVPLLEHDGVMNKVEERFQEVLEHLTGEPFKRTSTKVQEEGLLNRFTKRLKLR